MQRLFLHLAYDGSAYHGWQRQPNALGVQQVVEETLSQLYAAEVEVVGSGRTDAGVHALAQWVHADLPDRFSAENLRYRLNGMLPKDIAVERVAPVVADAHARFSATQRSYIYRLAAGKDPFRQGQVLFVDRAPSAEHLQASVRYLLGTHDFRAFSKSNTDVDHYLCELTAAAWKTEGDELQLHISANRFLRNMVRAIVGTCLDLERQGLPAETMAEVLAGQQRSGAGASAPAHGLYLAAVDYPAELFI